MSDYTLVLDLANEAQPPDKGILSRTLFSDDGLKVVLFGFAQGRNCPNIPPPCPRSCTSSGARRS
jgi:hypothetical protein